MAKRSVDISQMSADERLALIEDLWESLDDTEREEIQLSPEQQAELDRRLDSLEREGPQGVSPEELHDRLRRRSS